MEPGAHPTRQPDHQPGRHQPERPKRAAEEIDGPSRKIEVKKFLDTYTEPWTKTERLITGYVNIADTQEEEIPAELVEDEPAEGVAWLMEGKPKGGHKVPENFLYMAEYADTEKARAWWQRRCDRYAREGE